VPCWRGSVPPEHPIWTKSKLEQLRFPRTWWCPTWPSSAASAVVLAAVRWRRQGSLVWWLGRCEERRSAWLRRLPGDPADGSDWPRRRFSHTVWHSCCRRSVRVSMLNHCHIGQWSRRHTSAMVVCVLTSIHAHGAQEPLSTASVMACLSRAHSICMASLAPPSWHGTMEWRWQREVGCLDCWRARCRRRLGRVAALAAMCMPSDDAALVCELCVSAVGATAGAVGAIHGAGTCRAWAPHGSLQPVHTLMYCICSNLNKVVS